MKKIKLKIFLTMNLFVLNFIILSEGEILCVSEGKTEEWRRVLEVNLLGPCICAREAVKLMRTRQAEDSHIININRSIRPMVLLT